MTTHRCYVEPESWNGPRVVLSVAESHHLLHVMRARRSDIVEVFDGQGRHAEARLVDGAVPAGKRTKRDVTAAAELELLADPVTCPSRSPRIILLQCLPKGKRMDLVVEKCTELAVSNIVPVMSEHVVARPSSDDGRERVERWRRLTLSAARQSHSVWLPELADITDYPDALNIGAACDLFIVGALAAGTPLLRDVLRGVSGSSLESVALLIGPEGDLSPSEMSTAIAAGALPASFGVTVLRTETAAIYGASVLAYEFPGHHMSGCGLENVT